MQYNKPLLPVSVQSFLFLMMGNMTDSSYSPMDQFIKNRYLLTSAEIGLITSSIFIGSMAVSVISGYFVDRMGNRSALRIAFLLMALGSTVVATSSLYATVIAGYFIIGFGYGIVTPSTNSEVIKHYYPHHANAMGIKQSGVPAGVALAALILPFITLRTGISYPYFFLAGAAIIMAILVGRDKQSAYPRNRGNINYFRDFADIAKNRYLISVCIAVAFLSWAQQGLLTYYVLYMRFRGFPILSSDLFLVVLVAGSVAGRMLWVNVSEKYMKGNRVLMLSIILLSSGLMVLAITEIPDSVALIIASTFATGLFGIGWNSTFVTFVSEIAPREKIGTFSGLSLFIIGLGTIIGAPISGVIIDLTSSYNDMWYVMASMLVLMSILILIFSRTFGGRRYGSVASEVSGNESEHKSAGTSLQN